jgi:hypothetical protein
VPVRPVLENGTYEVTATAKVYNFDGEQGREQAALSEGTTDINLGASFNKGTCTFNGVSPGKHRIYVELLNNDD